MKKLSETVLKAEEAFTSALLVLITVLVFASAIARTLHHPINWAQDVSLLAFGWLTFIGADLVIKKGGLIRIDMIANKLPQAVQKILAIIFDVLMLLFLLILVIYGGILVSQSWLRTFNTLPISYAWCTLAVPVGAFFMLFSIGAKSIEDVKRPLDWGK
jgi:TRAP-type C4-dicarboxylate transport system permease small subunit